VPKFSRKKNNLQRLDGLRGGLVVVGFGILQGGKGMEPDEFETHQKSK
jgi:hypothetical protein